MKQMELSMATQENAAPDYAARAKETGRNAFLAGLGFYGKAFDQVQEQFDGLQEQLEERRAKANELYAELVARGEKVETDTKEAIEDIELPEFKIDSLVDREKLNAQLEKAKARFNELKESIRSKPAT
jgi:predicted nuclease with TOPRIM domain